ncbi:hypothetical protein D5R81_16680 [Parashewanella spongiae]|uniref:Uncharacterized protein n=1 Tax=Parashewanella spongiae TaxID=342950 RepID=A0A3A6TFR4_9GAMM|nr:hypothetical protein [Parashewanella spongiae]MCL1080118.1 hypothetical protein [Parashewanella spongiae]RJY07080.1 hypothetical protein D5R81_16680 [Parashewanella spongiae]
MAITPSVSPVLLLQTNESDFGSYPMPSTPSSEQTNLDDEEYTVNCIIAEIIKTLGFSVSEKKSKLISKIVKTDNFHTCLGAINQLNHRIGKWNPIKFHMTEKSRKNDTVTHVLIMTNGTDQISEIKEITTTISSQSRSIHPEAVTCSGASLQQDTRNAAQTFPIPHSLMPIKTKPNVYSQATPRLEPIEDKKRVTQTSKFKRGTAQIQLTSRAFPQTQHINIVAEKCKLNNQKVKLLPRKQVSFNPFCFQSSNQHLERIQGSKTLPRPVPPTKKYESKPLAKVLPQPQKFPSNRGFKPFGHLTVRPEFLSKRSAVSMKNQPNRSQQMTKSSESILPPLVSQRLILHSKK